MNKLFFVLLAALSCIFLYLIFSNFTVLNSDRGLDYIMDAYHRDADWVTYGVPLAYLLLLTLANREYYRGGSPQGFLWSGLFFILLTALDWIFISNEFFHFKQRMGVWKGEYSLAGIFGLFLILMCILLTMGSYFLIKTMRKFRS